MDSPTHRKENCRPLWEKEKKKNHSNSESRSQKDRPCHQPFKGGAFNDFSAPEKQGLARDAERILDHEKGRLS